MRRIPGHSLWVGHVGDAWDWRAILDAGITVIVDLAANEAPLTPPRECVYCRVPLIDGAENPTWLLRAAIDIVDEFLRAEASTLVFCSGGMSRSLVVAAAALAKANSIAFDDALKLVTESGPADVSPPLLDDVRGVIG